MENTICYVRLYQQCYKGIIALMFCSYRKRCIACLRSLQFCTYVNLFPTLILTPTPHRYWQIFKDPLAARQQGNRKPIVQVCLPEDDLLNFIFSALSSRQTDRPVRFWFVFEWAYYKRVEPLRQIDAGR